MVCDFETNIFLSLSFFSLMLSHDLLNKISISKFIGYVLMHLLTLVYQVFLTSRTFNWYLISIGIISLRGFPPIATKHLGITTNLGAIGGFYGTEIVIWL